jgi:hypothetical protein
LLCKFSCSRALLTSDERFGCEVARLDAFAFARERVRWRDDEDELVFGIRFDLEFVIGERA